MLLLTFWIVAGSKHVIASGVVLICDAMLLSLGIFAVRVQIEWFYYVYVVPHD